MHKDPICNYNCIAAGKINLSFVSDGHSASVWKKDGTYSKIEVFVYLFRCFLCLRRKEKIFNSTDWVNNISIWLWSNTFLNICSMYLCVVNTLRIWKRDTLSTRNKLIKSSNEKYTQTEQKKTVPNWAKKNRTEQKLNSQ